MSARLPLLHKTPFLLDERPLTEATSPHAGVLSLSRALRALGLPGLIEANLDLRKRQGGFAEAQFIESICLLQAVGGECPDDMRLLKADACLERGLGYELPGPTAVRGFLERFHDKKLETLRPQRQVQKSFIFPSSGPVGSLQEVQRGLVGRIAKLYEKQGQPLRYVGLRLLKAQGVLFKDGTDRHFHAVVTNQSLEGGRLLEWHREKAGTVEHTHDEVKNELGGAHVPSQRFGVNSAWFKIALLTYNLVSAIKGLCLEGEERTARMKRFRLLVIHVAGRMNRNNCVMGLRLCNNEAALQRMQRIWAVFALPTQATSSKPLGGGRGG